MKISNEVYINSMNDISKHFQIMFDNKDKKIADLQSQFDQQKAMWNELKEWLIQIIKIKGNSPKYYKLNDVLEKMRELEGEDE